MNTATTPITSQPTSVNALGLAHDPSEISRKITETFCWIWPKGSQPRRNTIAGLRARLMTRTSDPFSILYRVGCGALDEGKPVKLVVQAFRDLIAALEAYDQRRMKWTAGVLPFEQVAQRAAVVAIREDAEADTAEALMNCNDIPSLETARRERLEAIEAEERKVCAITERIAFLRSR